MPIRLTVADVPGADIRITTTSYQAIAVPAVYDRSRYAFNSKEKFSAPRRA